MKELEENSLEAFKRGDTAGADAVYTAYGDAIYRVCFRLCGNQGLAEDLTQETFVAAYKNRARFEGRSSFGTWLYRIAMNCCRTHLRKHEPLTVPLIEERSSVGAATENDSINLIAIEGALNGLQAEHREAILLVKIEGLKYREAAVILDVPQGTVQSRVFEGMRRLRELCGVHSDVEL